MSGNSAAERVVLAGPCTVDAAPEFLALARIELEKIAGFTPAPVSVELDLAGVRELDACGGQLLAVLVDNLSRRGISTLPCGISPEVERSLVLLGFAEALGLKTEQRTAA